jgi:hypothetical protein
VFVGGTGTGKFVVGCLPKISLRHSFSKMYYKMCSYMKRRNEQKFGFRRNCKMNLTQTALKSDNQRQRLDGKPAIPQYQSVELTTDYFESCA